MHAPSLVIAHPQGHCQKQASASADGGGSRGVFVPRNMQHGPERGGGCLYYAQEEKRGGGPSRDQAELGQFNRFLLRWLFLDNNGICYYT